MVSVIVKPSALSGTLRAPPSKSFTHRAIVLSSLAEGESVIKNPLYSRDTLATLKGVQVLGAKVNSSEKETRVTGLTRPKLPDDVINSDNSGTTIRLLTAVSALTEGGHTVLTGDQSIRRRPMQPLLDALGQLGVKAWSSRGNGCPPVIVKGGGIRGGNTSIRGDVSSQFISALLIACAKASQETKITMHGRGVSRPYIEATLYMMNLFGAQVEVLADGNFRVPPGQSYHRIDFEVPGDFSSAALQMAAASVAGGSVRIEGLNLTLNQPDMRITEILQQLGVAIECDKVRSLVSIKGGRPLRGGQFNLSDSPDLLPVVAVLALKAVEPVTITGVAHARFKETDRLSVLAKELSKLGAEIKESTEGLTVWAPSELKKACLDAHDDHRLFMALCVAAMAVEDGCEVEGLESLDVSYPSFIDDLRAAGASIEKR